MWHFNPVDGVLIKGNRGRPYSLRGDYPNRETELDETKLCEGKARTLIVQDRVDVAGHQLDISSLPPPIRSAFP